jgi:hypothetical protein
MVRKIRYKKGSFSGQNSKNGKNRYLYTFFINIRLVLEILLGRNDYIL